MATSFFYIYVMVTSFFYIYIDIYKLTERPVVLLNAIIFLWGQFLLQIIYDIVNLDIVEGDRRVTAACCSIHLDIVSNFYRIHAPEEDT